MTRALAITHFLALAACCNPASADDKKDPTEVRGTVVRVLGDRLVIHADEPDRKLEVDAARDVKVTINGKDAGLGGLRPGMRVRVVRDKDGKASSVTVEQEEAKEGGRELKGTIRRAVPADGGMRLMFESELGEIYSHPIRGDAKVSVGGESAKAGDLAPGMAATLALDGQGAIRQVTAERRSTSEPATGGTPGLAPGRSSSRYEVAAGRSIPFAGTFDGTFALGPVLGADAGQQSEDTEYVRPLYTAGREPWTLNVLSRKEAFRRAGQQPGQPDPYVEAFLRNDGRGDPYPNSANEVPGYPAWYWADPSSRYVPLDNRYRSVFRFGLGEQEPRSERGR